MSVESELDRHASQFDDGNRIVATRIQKWNRLEGLARPWFRRFVDKVNTHELIDELYFDSSLDRPGGDFGRYVSIRFGQHPVMASNDATRFATEGGCCLHLFQDGQGYAWSLLFPFESDVQRLGDSILHLAWKADPDTLNEIDFDLWARRFLSYAQVTAVRGKPSVHDRLAVYWMRGCRSFRRQTPVGVVGAIVSWMATLASFRP